MRIRVEGLRFSYGATPVLQGIDLDDIPPGQVTATIGPNAAGKSTLFKCIAGLLKPSGSVSFDGQAASVFRSRAEYSRLVSYLPQEYPSTAALTVFEAILLARQQSASWIVGDDDLSRVAAVLDRLELDALALRYLGELSGGQRQMVAVAQALAREPRVLLLDEPTSSLDLQRQLELLSLVRSIAVERGITVLIAMHDLNLAARFADRLIVLHRGLVHASGTAAAVLTEPMLREVYGVEARIAVDGDGVAQVTPLWSVRDRAGTRLGDDGCPRSSAAPEALSGGG
jgi:iron complex transport system ATP-binding protein